MAREKLDHLQAHAMQDLHRTQPNTSCTRLTVAFCAAIEAAGDTTIQFASLLNAHVAKMPAQQGI